jgi:hypothetical protein
MKTLGLFKVGRREFNSLLDNQRVFFDLTVLNLIICDSHQVPYLLQHLFTHSPPFLYLMQSFLARCQFRKQKYLVAN